MKLNATAFLLLLSFNNLTHAQDKSKGAIVSNDISTLKTVTGKTYAVIVGIDNYQSKKIHPLYNAVADAKAFEQFLGSKAGGEVPIAKDPYLITYATQPNSKN